MSVEAQDVRLPHPRAGEDALNWLKRFGFRWLTLYILLFIFFGGSLLWNIGYNIPWLAWLGNVTLAVSTFFVPWIGERILGHPFVPMLSADNLFDYMDVGILLGFAFLCSLIWTILDRERQRERAVYEITRLLARYSLAMVMFDYGFMKVFDIQFTQPSPIYLMQPFGDLRPGELMWEFMGYSQFYSTFAGVGEVVGGLLLLFRRTTTCGALIVVAIMTNVTLMNVSYFDPIRVGGANYLLMALFLLLPDAQRLMNAILGCQGFPGLPVTRPWMRGWMKPASIALKALIIGIMLYYPASSSLAQAIASNADQKMPMNGIYQVKAFQIASRENRDEVRWERVGIEDFAGTPSGPDPGIGMPYYLGVRTADDAIHYYALKIDRIDATHGVFEMLQCGGRGCLSLALVKHPLHVMLRYLILKSATSLGTRLTQPSELALRGTIGSTPVSMRLIRFDPSRYPLVGTPFHFVEPDDYILNN